MRRGLVAAALIFLVAAGCTSEPAGQQTAAAETPSPFQDCSALTAPPPSAAPASAPAASSSPAADRLPDLSLPCFTGGKAVALGAVRGPAVINLWASWCGPCREELPVMQRFADRAGKRLHVVGVDIGDGRDAAASFATARQVTVPTLYDRERKVLVAVGRTALPVTLFVDSAGRVVVHNRPLDARGLADLTRLHTGVAVTP